jgi:GNAT superfamily N-acetyltransferase
LIYRQEFIDDIYEDCQPLIQQHWEEIALNQDAIKLNPNWDAYKQLEGIGAFRIFTARDGGKLVGYFAVFVEPNLHYQDHLFARNDVLFLHKDYRKGFCGIKLIRFAEKCLKDDGVSVLVINTKTHRDFSSVLARLGFSKTETVHTKVIGA